MIITVNKTLTLSEDLRVNIGIKEMFSKLLRRIVVQQSIGKACRLKTLSSDKSCRKMSVTSKVSLEARQRNIHPCVIGHRHRNNCAGLLNCGEKRQC